MLWEGVGRGGKGWEGGVRQAGRNPVRIGTPGVAAGRYIATSTKSIVHPGTGRLTGGLSRPGGRWWWWWGGGEHRPGSNVV